MKSVLIKDKWLDSPVIQGGMGIGVSLGNLAGHVAANGGMGVISGANPGYRQPDFAKNRREANRRALIAEIRKAKELSNGRGMVAVNIMVALNDGEDLARVAAQQGADAVIGGAGLPLSLPSLVEGTKTAIAPIVSSAKAASLICRSWKKHYGVLPDFLVVEGSEAGGHLGFSSDELSNHLACPLDQIVLEVMETIIPFEAEKGGSIPVFAAGGIYSSEDIRHMLSLGTSGVQIATRFIATHECDASPEYKQAYINAKKEDIVIVKSPVGMPGRALRSPLIERLELGQSQPVKSCGNCLRPCDPAKTPYCITGALTAAARGDWENGLFFCGSNAYKLDEILSVKELMAQLTEKV
ncbi:MAG TPA: nitronate monooxygenase [Ruminococcaceae bacterium]|nr:nitronate monooxygenase [Oscillospiraceae bacterium]